LLDSFIAHLHGVCGVFSTYSAKQHVVGFFSVGIYRCRLIFIRLTAPSSRPSYAYSPGQQPSSVPSEITNFGITRHIHIDFNMGLLTLVEDRPTPKAVYNWRVYTAACVASWAACMIGYDSAFIGTTLALPSFVKEFRFAEMKTADLNLTKANIVSVYQAGAFFGAFGAYASSHYIGRRKSLILWTLIVSSLCVFLVRKNRY
jgi:hypothetical protein